MMHKQHRALDAGEQIPVTKLNSLFADCDSNPSLLAILVNSDRFNFWRRFARTAHNRARPIMRAASHAVSLPIAQECPQSLQRDPHPVGSPLCARATRGGVLASSPPMTNSSTILRHRLSFRIRTPPQPNRGPSPLPTGSAARPYKSAPMPSGTIAPRPVYSSALSGRPRRNLAMSASGPSPPRACSVRYARSGARRSLGGGVIVRVSACSRSSRAGVGGKPRCRKVVLRISESLSDGRHPSGI